MTDTALVNAGKESCKKFADSPEFVLDISKASNLLEAYKYALEVTPLKQGPATATGLRKADVIYQKWIDVSWKLCQYILRQIGPPVGYSIQCTITHPQASDIRRFASEFSTLVAKSPVPSKPIQIKSVEAAGHKKGAQRSYYVADENTIYLRDNPDRGVVWHELGHWLEHVAGYTEAAEDYHSHRTAGDRAVRLSSGPVPGYNMIEMAKPDSFIDPYCGKIYQSGGTELLSMGIQYLEEDPASLWLEDKDLFYFVIGALRYKV